MWSGHRIRIINFMWVWRPMNGHLGCLMQYGAQVVRAVLSQNPQMRKWKCSRTRSRSSRERPQDSESLRQSPMCRDELACVYQRRSSRWSVERIALSFPTLRRPVSDVLRGILEQKIFVHHDFYNSCCAVSWTKQVGPIVFATNVWDRGFDIYGNWVFNAAEAAAVLGSAYNVWVERLQGLWPFTRKTDARNACGLSIRGPLTGSASAYPQGHLIAVTGYDALTDQYSLHRSGFSDRCRSSQLCTSWLLEAWNRRGRVAYCFLYGRRCPQREILSAFQKNFPSWMTTIPTPTRGWGLISFI